MEIRFDGQVAIVTGASTGIGAALARAFGAAGAAVAVHYNSSEEAARAVARDIEAAGGTAMPIQADVRDAAEVRAAVTRVVEQLGRIDILVNNAGGMVERVPIVEMPDDVYQDVVDLNLTSVFQLCKLVVPIMQRQRHGNVINITSIAARHGGGRGAVLYAASKSAVSTLTRGLAKEVVADNIRVNAIAPGVILTPFHERYTSDAQMAAMVATIPMGRAGTPEEVAGTALFLASDELSGYITGQIIEVNGGQLMP